MGGGCGGGQVLTLSSMINGRTQYTVIRSFARSRGSYLVLGSWSCSDVGVPGRLVGVVELGNHPDHPPSLCGRDGWTLDAAGGLENLQYCDANPTKVLQKQRI